ncbi:hypothetical protein E2C01_035283 [Portunus trituberculatus]|uniref:Uncharacterized protein n=1 Tax=Portunus trituberculatus TaxID=210409 RepID=A0A5B7F9C8_PORTR|nr:hypothetical protein [Portunus trituberculatus]
MLHHLLKIMEDSKVEDLFTRMISEGRGMQKFMMNIEASKDGDLREKKERKKDCDHDGNGNDDDGDNDDKDDNDDSLERRNTDEIS